MTAAPAKADAKKPATNSETGSPDAVPVQPSAPILPRVMAPPEATKHLEFGRNSWHTIAPADHVLEQVLDPRYLWHKHTEIRPGDKIEIRHALFEYEVTILVREVDKEAQAILGYPVIRELTKEKLSAPDLSGAHVEFLGAHKWCVRLGGFLMTTGFDTQLEAEAWLRKKQARGA